MIIRALSLAVALSSTAIWHAQAESGVAFESGVASFYGSGQTASGEVTTPSGLTAAHRTLPFGTMVLITNVGNGKTVVVRIVDRGPFRRGRIIDVSHRAAVELDMIEDGLVMVSVERQ